MILLQREKGEYMYHISKYEATASNLANIAQIKGAFTNVLCICVVSACYVPDIIHFVLASYHQQPGPTWTYIWHAYVGNIFITLNATRQSNLTRTSAVFLNVHKSYIYKTYEHSKRRKKMSFIFNVTENKIQIQSLPQNPIIFFPQIILSITLSQL